MRDSLLRWMAGWIERGRKAGFFLLVIALCAGLGLLIALPLWLFATRQPRIYTVVALSLLAGGLVFLAARAVVRRRRLHAGHPGLSFLSGILTVLMTVVSFAGIYLMAVAIYRGLWIIAAVAAAITGLFLWLLGRARAAARKARKPPSIPAENIGR